MKTTFRSLAEPSYKVWLSGLTVSNVGGWIQRATLDWVVLTQLSDHSVLTVGLVEAAQFAVRAVFMNLGGAIADRFDGRRTLIMTQIALCALSACLAVLSFSGLLQLWHAFCISIGIGLVSALDAPTRHTFSSELVSRDNLANAVALNSASFHAARIIGPGIAGLIIVTFSIGWAFLLNVVTFVAMIVCLLLIREEGRGLSRRKSGNNPSLSGFKLIWQHRQLKALLISVFLVSALDLNFPIFILAMTTKVFEKSAGEYGILSSISAVGSVLGALYAAKRTNVRFETLLSASGCFGLGCLAAALAPNTMVFGVTLFALGIIVQTFNISATSLFQLSASSDMRGRAMAVFLTTSLGGAIVGPPLVGWVADEFGPRWSLALAASSGFISLGILAFCVIGQQKNICN